MKKIIVLYTYDWNREQNIWQIWPKRNEKMQRHSFEKRWFEIMINTKFQIGVTDSDEAVDEKILFTV